MEINDIINSGVASSSNQGLTADKVRQMINEQTTQNNAWSAEQAQKQMEFQEYMSNTAHQREIADLKAAGLNPILSAGGQGATVTSGAMANGDQSGNMALVAYLGKIVDSLTSMEIQRNNAENNLAVADMYNAATRYAAQLGYSSAISSAGMHASAQRYSADASRIASMYGTDINYKNQREQREWQSSNPQSVAGLVSSLVNAVAEGAGYNSAYDAARILAKEKFLDPVNKLVKSVREHSGKF